MNHDRCVQHRNHHCIHSHQCNNPLHQQLRSASRSKSHEKQTKSTKRLHEPQCKRPITSEIPSDILREIREKQKKIDELQKQLEDLRKRKPQPAKEVKHPHEPNDYHAMYHYLKLQNEKLRLETEELKIQKEILQTQLKLEKQTVKQVSHEKCNRQRLAFLEEELLKYEQLKKEHSDLQHKFKRQEEELKSIRLKLSESEKINNKSKDTAKSSQDLVKKLGEQKQALLKQLNFTRQKYDQQAKHNIQLTEKMKEMKERNRMSVEGLEKECKDKVRSADIKFGFSCDQINALRQSEQKLKGKVKELQDLLKEKQKKIKAAENNKIQKELRSLYQKSTKDNQSLRERVLQQQQQNEKLRDSLKNTKSQAISDLEELKELLKLRDTELKNLQTARAQTQREIIRLREVDRQYTEILAKNGDSREKQNADKESNHEDDMDDHRQEKPMRPSETSDFLHQQTMNQRVQYQRLQRQNIQLQSEVQGLRSRVANYQKQSSSSNLSQFQQIIKDNNKRIKQLILEKGKQIEANSYLRIEIQQLRQKLNSSISTINSDSPTTELYERNLNDLQKLKSQLADRDFQLLQLRKQIYEVNNQYSDYYILRDDNQHLRTRIQQLVDIIETLKRSGIHNSLQKEQLIMQNQLLVEQVERSRFLRV